MQSASLMLPPTDSDSHCSSALLTLGLPRLKDAKSVYMGQSVRQRDSVHRGRQR